jgi:hypothetical protein
MVCPADWEPRHPSDFYRNRSDQHKLPFTRTDDGADPALHWTTSISGNTYTLKGTPVETVTIAQGDYYLDTLKGITSGKIALFLFNGPGTGPLVFPQSTTSNPGGTFVLPTTPTTGGQLIITTSYGYLTKATIAAGSPNVTVPAWTNRPGSLFAAFSYGT